MRRMYSGAKPNPPHPPNHSLLSQNGLLPLLNGAIIILCCAECGMMSFLGEEANLEVPHPVHPLGDKGDTY